MKKQLLWGSLSGTLQLIVSTVLILITIPIFIDKLGLQLYSIFSLLRLFNNVNVFLNLGLNTSLIKFVAGQGKSLQSNYDIAVSFILLFMFLIPVSALSIYYNNFIFVNLFNLDSIYITSETITLFDSIIISNCMLLLGQIFSAVLDAQQKVYLSNFALILYNLLYWGLILFSLLKFPGLTSISYSILVSTSLWFVIVIILFRKTWGTFSIINFHKYCINTARKQLSYGFKLYLSGSISFFYEPVTKILISHFIGLNEVAFFDIAVRVKNQIWNLISRLFYPIFPLVSMMSDKNSIKNLIHTVEQKTSFLIIPVIISFIFIAKSFTTIWIGEDVEIISLTMIFITSGYFCAIIVIPIYQYLMAKGHPGKTVIIQLVNVFVNSILFFTTLHWLGYYAAVVGSVGAIMSSFSLTLFYQKKYLDSLILDNFKQLRKLLLILGINLLFGLILSEFIKSDLLMLLLIPIVLFSVSIFTYRKLKIFNRAELSKFSDEDSIIFKYVDKILIAKGTSDT